MEDVKIYILVEDEEKDTEIRIDGNLSLFKKLLATLNDSGLSQFDSASIEDQGAKIKLEHAPA